MTQTMTTRVETTTHGGAAPYSWHRNRPSAGPRPGTVCRFWQNGNCARNPCRFFHPDRVTPMSSTKPANSLKYEQFQYYFQRPLRVVKKRATEEPILPNRKPRTFPQNAVDKCDPPQDTAKVPLRRPTVNANTGCQMPPVKPNVGGLKNPSVKSSNDSDQKVQLKICEGWMKNNCTYGEKCKYLHSWSSGEGFSKMVQLEGHQKAITGINLPSDFDKLFTASEDGTVRLWNGHTGECVSAVDMGAPVGCLTSEGPWVFAGITNAVKAWNVKTGIELTLDLPAGRVYSLDVSEDMLLFAGHQNGSIYVWKLNLDGTMFDAKSILEGHSGAVISVVYGAKRLYSGSMDNTIRGWDVEKMACIHSLKKHSDVVMSLLCWEQYLFSCSLDNTLQVWGSTENGELEVVFSHKEEQGILSLRGMYDKSGKPILLCSCNDNTVRLYELPTFIEQGRIFAKEEVRTMHAAPGHGGLFFTGDGSGLVSVWNCSGELTATLFC